MTATSVIQPDACGGIGAPLSSGRSALICGVRPEGTNAILEYTECLDQALGAVRAESTIIESEGGRLPDLGSYETVVLQYNPFLYGRWGFAPRLVASLLRACRSVGGPRLALMIHETYFPISDWRSALMGSTQYGQLRLLHAMSELVFVSIEPWAKVLASWHPRRPVVQLPIGSNLPDRRSERAAARQEIGADAETFVVVSFSGGHPSRSVEHSVTAVNAIVDSGQRVMMLNLGAGAPVLEGLDGEVKVVQPGFQPAPDLARMLSAGDLFLAPFTEGVSARRGSMMAALQHEVAVLGTRGHLTDGWLGDSAAVELVDVHEVRAFADTAAGLASDPTRLANLAAAGGELYRSALDWPVIADRVQTWLRPRSCREHSATGWRTRT